jgi:hypothetical protein
MRKIQCLTLIMLRAPENRVLRRIGHLDLGERRYRRLEASHMKRVLLHYVICALRQILLQQSIHRGYVGHVARIRDIINKCFRREP